MSRGNVLLEAESFEAVDEENVSKETKEKSQTKNGVYVKGMALPFGTPSRNGVQYEKESVKEAHEDLVGRTMLFNHKQDWVTGHILNTEITEDGMYFEGDINPNAEMPNGVPVAEAIERGDINSVSIQAFIEQLGEEADEEAVIQNMETEKVAVKDFLEISAVSIPGFPQAEALPEHLQNQGVQPVTEMVGEGNLEQKKESLEEPEYEEGDFLEWEFGSGNSQGEVVDMTAEPGDSMSAGGNEFTIDEPGGENDVPLYKLEEWDEEEQAFTNNVVKFEDELSEADRPEAAEMKKGEPFAGYDSFEDCVDDNQDKSDPEAYCGEIKDRAEEMEQKLSKEQFEFSPVPTHVLYDTEEKAQRRAENLGLDEIHEHQMGEQTFYMAGENHEEWLNAIERENTLDRGENVGEALSDVDLTPPERVKNAAQAALDWEEENPDRQDCGTGVGDSRANSITNETLSPEDFLGGENTAIPDYLDSHEEDVTAEGPPTDWSDEEMNDCGNRQYAKWGYYLEWFQDKQEELQEAKEKVLGEDQSMPNNEEQEDTENEDVKSEQVSQEQFINFVAEHMEGLEANDVADAVGDSNFTGLDEGEVAELLAVEYELDFDTVMDAIGQLEDMESEKGDGDYDDDDMDEEEEDVEDKDREELEEQVKNQSEKIEELEDRIETFLDEDEGTSKQNAPTGESEDSSIKRRPTFKGLMD